MRKQVEHLQLELEKERAHNREKDKQLLETLSKLADSQAALAAGQAAQKQKELADKLIEGKIFYLAKVNSRMRQRARAGFSDFLGDERA